MTRRAVSRRVIPIQRVTWPSLGLDFFHFFVVENKGLSICYQRQSAWNLSAPRFKITSDQSGPRHHSGTRGQRLYIFNFQFEILQNLNDCCVPVLLAEFSDRIPTLDFEFDKSRDQSGVWCFDFREYQLLNRHMC